MKKYVLIGLFTLVPFIIQAQVDAKYLRGAVPEVDGKVLFSKTIVPNKPISDKAFFDLLNNWAEKNYARTENSKKAVLLVNSSTHQIVCQGDQLLTFARRMLSLDEARMYYQLIMDVQDGKCETTIRNIRYDYADERGIKAEEQITDQVALRGEDKLYRNYDKFRIFTIDSINAIFNSLEVFVNGIVVKGASDNVASEIVQTGTLHVDASQTQTATMSGYKQIAVDKIPAKYTKALNEQILVAWNRDNNVNAKAALWGGTDNFWGKPVAFVVVSPSNTSQVINEGDTYTISFYTEVYKEAIQDTESTGKYSYDLTPIKTPEGTTTFSEAWMVLECKKVATPASLDINKDGTTYIGEILNVWVK